MVALFQIESFNIWGITPSFFIPQVIIGGLVCIRHRYRSLGALVNKTGQGALWRLHPM